MDELETIKATFFQECEELLVDLESGLQAMREGADDPETVNAVFRAVHSIKGGAGAFGFEDLVGFAHTFETLLDGVRSGRLAASTDVVEVLLRAADVLADLVAGARTGGAVDTSRTQAVGAELEAITGGASAAAAPQADEADVEALIAKALGFAPAPAAFIDLDDIAAGPAPEAAPPLSGWRIVFRPHRRLIASANEPGVLIRELERLGPLEIALDDSALPGLAELDPEDAYFAWTLRLLAPVEEARVRDVFAFVEDDCDLAIEALHEAPADAAPELPGLPEAGLDLAALIAASVAPPETAPALELPVATPAPAAAKPVSATAAAPSASSAPSSSSSSAQSGASAQPTIRVDPERIDRLIDLVGELVIHQAMLAQRVGEANLPNASNVAVGLDELERLTREIQEGVMAIRAQPVKSVFQRMLRLVRETASMTGKQARLVTEGETTEVDKTIIERIVDPITHMLRNAIDHGLETPEQRLAAGKPGEGVIRLAALHRGGRIVIEVSDDGKGIDRPRVRAIAEQKGLIAPDAQLTDDEVDNLIFLPGFSTASVVSDVSGRGVGMDVVRRSVQALGGRISIASVPGRGSTFTMSMPLTLAVLDGMVVDVAGQTLVLPLSHIVESLRPKAEDVRRLGAGGRVLSIRGEQVPLIDTGVVLGFRQSAPAPTDRVVLLIEAEDGQRAALVADAIQGQRQVVIKSLESNWRQVPGIAAATILGDGRVALILDVDALVEISRRPGAGPAPTETTLIAAE